MASPTGRLGGTDLVGVNRRLQELEAFKNTVFESLFKITYVEPDKVVEGMLRIADGTSWNPGSGMGIYQYRSGSWIKVG